MGHVNGISGVAGPVLTLLYPPAALPVYAAGAISYLHQLHGEGNGVPMQQSDFGEYFGQNGERDRIDDMVTSVLGD
jgi:hypothetical protein